RGVIESRVRLLAYTSILKADVGGTILAAEHRATEKWRHTWTRSEGHRRTVQAMPGGSPPAATAFP
ncbi:MAG TPA: hypothetical protein VK858_10045, partial [Longimicrobiales bacterium]|nr:hypothetical protein [Longimicrobiales bacterium]